ncbi:MAG: magnetosome biogenesis CDF transporter MamM [SAR324 cluster bacterium]|nr:magnetosome biogenesis CDF transporter MamM [SAR324 cluster bacterium]
MHCSNCTTCYRSIGWIGLVSNIFISLLKLFVGLISGSQALIADAMYSAKDLVTSGLIIVGLKVASQPVDKEHMYGHGKVEFILSLMISGIFIAITIVILVVSAGHLIEGKHKAPHLIALAVALFSIAANWVLQKYTQCVAKQVNSPMVKTLSKHHWSDMVSSGAVAGGIIGSHYLGLYWLDSLVAVFETLHLLYLGSEVFWDGFKGVMDYAAPKEIQDQVIKETLAVEDVQSVKNMKTRRIGQGLWIDLYIGLNPNVTVEYASMVAENVEDAIYQTIEHVAEINVRFESAEGLPELDIIPDGV